MLLALHLYCLCSNVVSLRPYSIHIYGGEPQAASQAKPSDVAKFKSSSQERINCGSRLEIVKGKCVEMRGMADCLCRWGWMCPVSLLGLMMWSWTLAAVLEGEEPRYVVVFGSLKNRRIVWCANKVRSYQYRHNLISIDTSILDLKNHPTEVCLIPTFLAL